MDDTADWAETAREVYTLTRDATTAKGFTLEPPDP